LCHDGRLKAYVYQSIEYNTTNGKLIRGHAVVSSGQELLQRPLTADEFKDLSTLGWLTEIWLGYMLILDDIIDGSPTRRKKPCWYKKPNVGLAAMNDACIMKSMVFVLLQKLFTHHPSYAKLVESFHEVSFLTEVGQECDISASRCRPMEWTMESYTTMITYKTGFMTYYHPFLLTLHYLNLATACNISSAKRILVPLGNVFQMQNDYLDIFGHAGKTGKEGTDIKENKCSWVIIEALAECSEAQRVYLLENYGKDTNHAAERIQDIFNSLPLTSAYEKEEDRIFRELKDMITQVDEREGLKARVFEVFLDSLYRKHRKFLVHDISAKS
jgi:farnesyl diphosphate synthase